jgi:hypothetical protein
MPRCPRRLADGIIVCLQIAGVALVDHCDEVAELKQFRRKLIGFLRLPLSISEAQLREELRNCSGGAFASYMRRFGHAYVAYTCNNTVRLPIQRPAQEIA